MVMFLTQEQWHAVYNSNQSENQIILFTKSVIWYERPIKQAKVSSSLNQMVHISCSRAVLTNYNTISLLSNPTIKHNNEKRSWVLLDLICSLHIPPLIWLDAHAMLLYFYIFLCMLNLTAHIILDEWKGDFPTQMDSQKRTD